MNNEIKIKDLLDLISKFSSSQKELDEIEEAYYFAKEIHKDEKRTCGEAYWYHELCVAYILADLNVDYVTIISALIHETMNNGTATYQDICDKFGVEVAEIVLSLSKINKLELTDDSESSSIYLRKILVGLSENVRVLFIKLADRLHNMRNANLLPANEAKRKANETMKVLVPIAHRLGINKIKSELEDLCLKILKPDVYDDILTELNSTREEMTDLLNEMKDDISEILKDYGLHFEIKGRVKSIYSIYNKLAKGRKFSDIYDILALRILLPKESDCYLAVGLIHAKYRPISKRFKDYIAMPKENMYQSLHTTLFGIDGHLFEVQLRTYEMNEIAEKGIASHWSYKEAGTKKIQSIMEQKLELFRNLIEENHDVLEDPVFAESVSKEFIDNLIYVYTPKGDVVELPQNATPIDFAYRIHSDVGDKTIGAIVNDNIVPLDYALQDGDIIKIKTLATSTPNKDWLKFVKTSQAKNKIKAFFSKKDKVLYIDKGKMLLEKELKKQKISLSTFLTNTNIEKIIKDLKLKEEEEIYFHIGSLRYLPTTIINLIYAPKSDLTEPLINTRNKSRKDKSYNSDVIVEGCDNIKVTLANCCKPIMGDAIVGYITKGYGISIHKVNCSNIGDVSERLIDVSWNENCNDYFYTQLIIETDSLSDHLVEIISKTNQKDFYIESIDKKEIENGINYILTVKIHNVSDLDKFITALNNEKFVKKVTR